MSPLPLTLQTIRGEFPGGCTITSADGEIVNKAPDRSECVVLGDITLRRHERWHERKQGRRRTRGQQRRGSAQAIDGMGIIGYASEESGIEEVEEGVESEGDCSCEEGEVVGLMEGERDHPNWNGGAGVQNNENTPHQDPTIPDCKGYIFSPPWMIFCLWWVTEWLGSLCYNWSSVRRKKALSLSRLSLRRKEGN